MVTPVAKFKSASSRTKILCLIIIRSNLKSNFTHRDPHRKNANLKNVRRVSAIAPLECAVGLERAWGRKGNAS